MTKKYVIDSLSDRYERFVSREALTKLVEEKSSVGLSATTILIGAHFNLTEMFMTKDLTNKELQKICKCKNNSELLGVMYAAIDELKLFLAPNSALLH